MRDRLPAFQRRGRIVHFLLAALLVVGLAPLAAGLWKIIPVNREALATSTQEFQLLLATSVSEKVELKIEGVRSEIVRVAQILGAKLDRRGGARDDEIHRALTTVIGKKVRYAHFSRGTEAGGSLSAGQLPSVLVGAFDEGVAEARALVETEPDRDQRVLLSAPIFVKGKPWQSVLVATVPVIDPEESKGMLSVVVDLRSMWESITSRDRGGNVVYAADSSGLVFASTNLKQVRPGQDMRRSHLVQRFRSGHGRARETMPFTDLRQGVGQELLGSYAATADGWGVFAQAPLDQVYAPVTGMVSSTLTSAALILGLAALGATFFAMTLSEPINRLAFASRAFARGDFTARVEVRTRHEIGELAHTFNVMATELEGQIDKLKLAAAENEEQFEGTILALAKAIDAKDPYTRGHSVRVNRYCVLVARALCLPAKEIRDIHVASLLHDVGKIGIDEAILRSTGDLTAEQYEVVKTHAALGANIMSPIPQMKSILPGLRWHHERMDGSGYPDGLKGKQIPIMARIIAVADTFDAVTSNRSYQKTRTFPEGLQLLHDLEGRLDPEVVATFDRVYSRGEIRPTREEREGDGTALLADPA